MAATISFLAGEGFTIADLAGMGLGFYGPGSFGASVRVGQYQDNTYITDGTGSTEGAKVDNVKYVAPDSGQLGTGDTHLLTDIPNYLATVNIRFTNDTPCQVQNATATYFDRTSISNPPSGVLPKFAQVVHPWNTMGSGSPVGSGDTDWWTPGGTGGLIDGFTWDPPVALVDSPGTSGLSPSGVDTVDLQHDWYGLCSASPLSVGSKTQFALYVQLEYL